MSCAGQSLPCVQAASSGQLFNDKVAAVDQVNSLLTTCADLQWDRFASENPKTDTSSGVQHQRQLPMQVLPEEQSLSGKAAGAEEKAEPILDPATDAAAVDLETVVLPAPVDVPVSHEAMSLTQDKPDSSQPGGKQERTQDPTNLPLQVSRTSGPLRIRVIFSMKR